MYGLGRGGVSIRCLWGGAELRELERAKRLGVKVECWARDCDER